MTEQEQAAATAAAEAEAKAKAEKDAADAKAKAEADANAGAQDEPQIDYKAELAKEKEKREKAEKELAEKRFKEAEAKRKGGGDPDPDPDPDPEDKPLTAKDLDALETRLFQKAQKELQASRIQEVASSLAGGNPDLAALILETHKNRTFPDNLSIDEQLEESFAIIHGRKSAAKAVELARALRSKGTAYSSSGTSHQDEPASEEPKISSGEATALKDAGLTWDGKRRAYKKAIAGGKKTYFFDPKTKKRWTE